VSSLGRNDIFGVIGGAPTARIIEGVINRVAANGDAFVSAASFDAGLEFGPCGYEGPVPIVGKACVVAIMTGTTKAWIISWDGAGIGSFRPVAKSAAYTARTGEYVICTGSFNVTLPAPIAGRVVGVKSVNGTGAAPLTISTPSGAILGSGIVAAATTMKLGWPGAYVTLLADGTNWHVIDGGQDTGWIAMPYATDWSNSGGSAQPGGYRKDAQGIVHLRGMANCGAGTMALGKLIATLPTGFRPPGEEWCAVDGSFGTGNRGTFLMVIDTSGQLSIYDQAGNAPSGSPTYISFANLTFSTI